MKPLDWLAEQGVIAAWSYQGQEPDPEPYVSGFHVYTVDLLRAQGTVAHQVKLTRRAIGAEHDEIQQRRRTPVDGAVHILLRDSRAVALNLTFEEWCRECGVHADRLDPVATVLWKDHWSKAHETTDDLIAMLGGKDQVLAWSAACWK